MPKILFVCLGNICRSPMAEYVMKDLVKKHGVANRYTIDSAGTYGPNAGDPVHPGTRKILAEHSVPCPPRKARTLGRNDHEEYDWIIGMEESNLHAIARIFHGRGHEKIRKLLDFTPKGGDIDDPWYTDDFESTWRDVQEGCQGLLRALETKK